MDAGGVGRTSQDLVVFSSEQSSPRFEVSAPPSEKDQSCGVKSATRCQFQVTASDKKQRGQRAM